VQVATGKATPQVAEKYGDADTVVPTDVGCRWAKAATDLKMKDFKYMELPRADHGPVITQSMPEIFKFFKERTR